MRLVAFITLLAGTLGAQMITHGPLVSNITHSTARFTFTTNASPRNADVVLRRPGKNDRTLPAVINHGLPVTVMAVATGLRPGTSYTVQARLNDGTIAGTPTTFMTSPEPNVHPELPADPQQVDTALPSGPYGDSSQLIVNSDCSNITEILARLSRLSGTLNYEVTIPFGTACRGRFLFPERPYHQGWVIVRSGPGGYVQTPAPSSRFNPGVDQVARFIANTLPTSQYTQPGFLPTGPCATHSGENGFAWVATLSTNMFPVYVCSDANREYTGPNRITDISGHIALTVTAPFHQLQVGDLVEISPNGYAYATRAAVEKVSGHTFVLRPIARLSSIAKFDPGLNPTFKVVSRWKNPPHRTGDVPPPSCEPVKDWFFNPSTGHVYWCTDRDQWRRFQGGGLGDYAAINVPKEAKRYRFTGIEVTYEKMPEPLPPEWDKSINGNQTRGVYRELINSLGSNVIWDRCYIHGWPYPQRMGIAMTLGGSDVAVINSYLDEISWWRPSGQHQLEGGIGIHHVDDGPALIHNNYLAVAGIGYFAPNNNLSIYKQVHDVTFTENRLQSYPKWRHGDPANNGVVYTHRNTWELKQGKNFKVARNEFQYGYSGVTAGQFILLTPRCSALPPPVNLFAINNGVATTTGTIAFSRGDVVAIEGTNSSYDGLWEIGDAICRGNACNRFVLRNAPANGVALGGRMTLRGSARGISDILIEGNTFVEGAEVLRLTGTSGCPYMHLPPTQRVAFRKNRATDTNIRSYYQGGRVEREGTYRFGDFGARAVLNLGWVEDLIVTDNQFIGNRGNMPVLLGTELISEGLDFSRNLFTFDEALPFRAVYHGGANGTAALNRGYMRDDEPNWRFENNRICCGLGVNASQYPPTTQWPTVWVGNQP